MELFRKTIEEILDSYDSNLNLEDFSRIPTGKYNTTYLVNTSGIPLILRVAPSEDNVFLFYERDNMLAEPEIHRLVSNHTDLKIPEIFHLDDSKKIIPRNYLLMEYLDAKPMGIQDVSGELGKQLRQLHQKDYKNYGYIWVNRPMESQDNWKDAFFIMWNKLVDDIVGVKHFTVEEESFVRKILDRYSSAFNHRPPAALLHMDVWHQNILIGTDGEVFLIDWDRALVGDPEIEFAVLEYCGTSSGRFWDTYGNPPDFKDKDFQIRRIFYYLYELMKYIVIEQGRRNNYSVASGYKQKSLQLLCRLS